MCRYFLNSGHGFAQILLRIGVAETDVAIAIFAETASVEPGNSGLIQQEIGEFPGADSGAGDIGEGVKRAARQQDSGSRESGSARRR